MLQILPRDLARTEKDVESMSIPAAAQFIEDLERSGAGSVGRSKVGYYGKFAYPFANLILVLIGMPLASVRRRGGQAVQIGLGLVVAFGYLAIQKLTEPFGYSGELPPLIVAWLPHVAFFFVALITLFNARK
jgi:lipopolysaccharide export system permease protein